MPEGPFPGPTEQPPVEVTNMAAMNLIVGIILIARIIGIAIGTYHSRNTTDAFLLNQDLGKFSSEPRRYRT
jgi:hypothetical protein